MGYWTGGEVRMKCNEKPLRPSRGWVVLRTGALAILAALRARKEAGVEKGVTPALTGVGEVLTSDSQPRKYHGISLTTFAPLRARKEAGG